MPTVPNIDLAHAIASRRRELQCSKDPYGRSRFFTDEFCCHLDIPTRLLHKIESAEVGVPKNLLRKMSAMLFPEQPNHLIDLSLEVR